MQKKQKVKCPNCSSNNTNKNGFVYSTDGKKQRYLCKSCGHIWREN